LLSHFRNPEIPISKEAKPNDSPEPSCLTAAGSIVSCLPAQRRQQPLCDPQVMRRGLKKTLTTGILDRTYNFFSTFFFSGRANSSDDKSDQEAGLKFRLSEAPEQPEAKATNKIAQASVLSDAENASDSQSPSTYQDRYK